MRRPVLARKDRRYDSRTPTTVMRKISVPETKQGFRDAIEGLTHKQLADAAGCGLDGAKKWIAGEALPSCQALINLARSLPSVDDWLIAETRPRIVEPRINPMLANNDVMAKMQADAVLPGPEGDAARAYLRAWRRT